MSAICDRENVDPPRRKEGMVCECVGAGFTNNVQEKTPNLTKPALAKFSINPLSTFTHDVFAKGDSG